MKRKIWGQGKKVANKFTKNIKGWIYYYPGKRKQDMINTPLLTPNCNVLTSLEFVTMKNVLGLLCLKFTYIFLEKFG